LNMTFVGEIHGTCQPWDSMTTKNARNVLLDKG
jgi:hypothetical protein